MPLSVLALIFSSSFVAERLATRDFQVDENQCRAKQKQEYSSERSTSGGNQPNPQTNSDSDPEKVARDYCIARRSAIASEYQAEIGKAATLISYVAMIAAFGALAIAVWAAKATRDTAEHAASAAHETARSVDVQVRLEGPLLFVHYISLSAFEQANPLFIRAAIRNAGRAPAILIN